MKPKPQRKPLTILDACRDPALFADWFRKDTWGPWFAFLCAVFALQMTPEQASLYKQCTGRTELPDTVAREVWLVCGRRAGKSFILALIAVFLACFFDYRQYLQPGERGVVMVIALDTRQAKVIFRYIRAFLQGVPMLARMIERETSDTIDLKNFISIEVKPASSKSTRGFTIVAALCDEIARWPTDDAAAEPDEEVLAALRPGMATIPNAMLLCASSPYARKGSLFEAYRKYYGQDGAEELVWKAPTRTMNGTVRQREIDRAMAKDPEDAMAEYMAEFRSDLASFVSRESVEACVEKGVRERPRRDGIRYYSFTDPSGGSSDSMTCAIGHKDGDVIVIDALREIHAPFDPESATDDLVRLNRSYGVSLTRGDKYASAWVSQAFEKRKIGYRHSELPKSQLYLNLLPHLNSRTIKLLDDPRTLNQICNLERRTSRGSRDSIDHPPHSHDDCANAIAGLAYVAIGRGEAVTPIFGTYGHFFDPKPRDTSRFDGEVVIVGADGKSSKGWATSR